MECACIGDGIDHDDLWDFEPSTTFPTAKKNWKCVECGRVIPVGEEYSFFSGVSDGRWENNRTCMDCHSVTEHLFCSWYWGQVWEMLNERIQETGEISWGKIAKLTQAAREKVCDMIEKIWEDENQ